MARKFVKVSDLEQGLLYTISDFFVCNTPFGKNFNAVLDDELIVKVPSYLADAKWPPSKLNEFKKKHHFFMYTGEKTSQQTGNIYSGVRFMEPVDWSTMCFCKIADCEDCSCHNEFDTQLKYLAYECECTKNYSYNFDMVRQKIEKLNPVLKPKYSVPSSSSSQIQNPVHNAVSRYMLHRKRKAEEEEVGFENKEKKKNDEPTPIQEQDSPSVPNVREWRDASTQTTTEDDSTTPIPSDEEA